ncbi:replicative DNA helicase [Fibrobacter sp. UWP2]|jgi:replicative DNA helicase|uniref:replicative DNA helicase n=1 Tax=Fibrobacter sp. UWP2 TaxID=1896216 RepID=UPI000923F55E|nr:replicative DNA helicase [Fibrobacter sp. UWP2]SHI68453.1 replicative DNA helicase [Fibrobacter sp. UWP2]
MPDFNNEQPMYENRPIPVDEQAERYLLGGILRDPNVMETLATAIPSDDFFFFERHRLVWHAMTQLFRMASPIDVLTLSAELEKEGKIQKCGGREYIFDLMDAVASSANVEWNVQHLRSKYVLRQLIKASDDTIKKSLDASIAPEEVLQDAEKTIFAIADQQVRKSLLPIEKFVTPLLDRLTNRKEGITGIPTGLTELDELTNGLQDSDLIILAARPGVGKTSFALTIAANAAIDYNRKVAFFSLEMDGVQLAQRLLCSRARVDQSKLRSGKLNRDEMNQIIAKVAPINQSPLYVDDNADLGIMELMSKARELKRKDQLDMLIVDYLQLMKTGGEENRAVAIGAISRGLKILAKELHIPVIALAQLSRKVEEKGRDRPQLSDLRESGSIEQDADMVWFVERPYVRTHKDEDYNKAELIVAKHRNGSVKDIPLYFEPNITTFFNAINDGGAGGEGDEYQYDDGGDMGATGFGDFG